MNDDARMQAVSDTSLGSPEKEDLIEQLSEAVQQGLPSSSEVQIVPPTFPPSAGQPAADETQGHLVNASVTVPRMLAGQPADVSLGGPPRP